MKFLINVEAYPMTFCIEVNFFCLVTTDTLAEVPIEKPYILIYDSFDFISGRWFRLINVNDLKKHNGPYDLEEFRALTSSQIVKSKKKLMTQYYGAVTDIFLQGNKKNKLPNPAHKRRMESFFNSVAAIMSYHIQICCLKSLYEFVDYIMDIKVNEEMNHLDSR